MEDYYEYLDSNGVTTLYKLIKDDTVALINEYSVTVNGITTNLDNHINDSDIHTPISVIEGMIATRISGLVNSAPETLDTLKELSDALGNDPNFATTVANQIGNKADKDTVYTKLETNALLEDKANSVHSHVISDITDFPTIPTKLSQLENDIGFGTGSGGVITSISWTNITDKPNFSTVAISGSYTDLSNTPTIPTKLSDLTNDSDFATDSNVVHKSGNETIAGVKTFTANIIKKNSGLDLQVNPSSDQFNSILFTDKNNVAMAYIEHLQTTSGLNGIGIFARDKSNGTHGIQITSDNIIKPLGDNTHSLGISGAKWKSVYATTYYGNLVGGITLNQSSLKMTVKDSNSETTRTNDVLLANSSNTSYGINVAFGGSGNTVVGAGESYTAQLNELVGNSQENLYLTADSNIFFKVGANTFADAKTVTLNTSAELSGLAKVTATTFVGALTGNVTGNCSGSSSSCTGNSASATKASYLDNYSNPNGNKIYLDWDNQVKSYVGLKVDKTTMGGLITTKNIGSQSVSSATTATKSTTQANSDNSTNIATTAWVRTYVNSVVGSNTVGSSVSAYWSNSSNVTATGQTSASGTYPACYSEYITKTPTVGTIYSGAQLYTKLAPYASATASTSGQGGSIKVTNITAQATFSNPISSTGKYLCTTANTVKFRAYVTAGNSSSLGTASVVDNSSTKSIFIRIE